MSTRSGISELGRLIITMLEHISTVNGMVLLTKISNLRQRCPVIVGPAVVGALAELEAHGLIEAYSPGCQHKSLACCVPPLARDYRLTTKGHAAKISQLSFVTGIAASKLAQ